VERRTGRWHYNDIPIYGDEDEWDDDSQSSGGGNKPESGIQLRRANTTGGRGVERWRNNFSDEYDEYDEYDRQENQYKQARCIYLVYGSDPVVLL